MKSRNTHGKSHYARFINYSYWSLGLIFSFALAWGYNSPHTPPETELGPKT